MVPSKGGSTELISQRPCPIQTHRASFSAPVLGPHDPAPLAQVRQISARYLTQAEPAKFPFQGIWTWNHQLLIQSGCCSEQETCENKKKIDGHFPPCICKAKKTGLPGAGNEADVERKADPERVSNGILST